MSEATSKQWRIHTSNNNPTMDALGGSVKNRAIEETILMPQNEPYEYRCFRFAGEEVPDNSLYPDSIAPIGSEYKRFVITNGVVTGCALYLKTAAATWTIFGSVT